MKFNISNPVAGTQKSIEVDDDNKCRVFFERRLGQQVEADTLGDDFKGYVFKITGGNDKDGFPMKQGVFSQGRVRLLLSEGTSCYRAKRRGERKRKSVRGCIVGPDIRVLSVSIVKKGDNEIPGLTDTVLPRRRAPKTASGIRKLYNIPKDENATVLIKKHVVRRTFKSKKNPDAPLRQKAPKIQRLVTEARLRRKKLIKRRRVDAWKKTQASLDEYHKLCHEYFEKQKKQRKDQEKAKTAAKEAPKDDKKVTAVTKPAKVVAPKPTTATNTGKTTKPAPATTTVPKTTTTTTNKNEKKATKTEESKVPAPEAPKVDNSGVQVMDSRKKVVTKVVKQKI